MYIHRTPTYSSNFYQSDTLETSEEEIDERGPDVEEMRSPEALTLENEEEEAEDAGPEDSQ